MPTVATFEIEYLQYLGPDGRLVRDDLPEFAHDRATSSSCSSRCCTCAPSTPRPSPCSAPASSAPMPAAWATRPRTSASAARCSTTTCSRPSYREYGAQFVRGVKPRDVLMYWGGDERGNDFSGPPHDYLLVRADRHPVPARGRRGAGVQAARRAARRGRLRRRWRLVEDRHLRRDQFRRRLHPALRAVHHQQRLGDLGAAQAQTGAQTLAQKGIAGGLDCLQVDGNDIIAVRAAMDHALKRARNGHGGSVLEFVTYRLSDHTTADDARRYRDDGRGEGGLGARADAAPAHLPDRAKAVERDRGSRLEGGMRTRWSTSRSTPISKPRCSRSRRCSTTSTPNCRTTSPRNAPKRIDVGGRADMAAPITLIEAITQALAWELAHDDTRAGAGRGRRRQRRRVPRHRRPAADASAPSACSTRRWTKPPSPASPSAWPRRA